jgi:NADH:ubiquinone oxidoreductase subunit H
VCTASCSPVGPSNNKYALLGGLRASAQMVSYEISMGMATVCVLLIAGNVSLTKIIDQQVFMGWERAAALGGQLPLPRGGLRRNESRAL